MACSLILAPTRRLLEWNSISAGREWPYSSNDPQELKWIWIWMKLQLLSLFLGAAVGEAYIISSDTCEQDTCCNLRPKCGPSSSKDSTTLQSSLGDSLGPGHGRRWSCMAYGSGDRSNPHPHYPFEDIQKVITSSKSSRGCGGGDMPDLFMGLFMLIIWIEGAEFISRRCLLSLMEMKMSEKCLHSNLSVNIDFMACCSNMQPYCLGHSSGTWKWKSYNSVLKNLQFQGFWTETK